MKKSTSLYVSHYYVRTSRRRYYVIITTKLMYLTIYVPSMDDLAHLHDYAPYSRIHKCVKRVFFELRVFEHGRFHAFPERLTRLCSRL